MFPSRGLGTRETLDKASLFFYSPASIEEPAVVPDPEHGNDEENRGSKKEEDKIMLSVRGIYENGQIRLLEPVPYKKCLNVIVTLLEQPEKIKNPRPIGLAEGMFQLTSSFFEELPEELLDAFEGKNR